MNAGTRLAFAFVLSLASILQASEKTPDPNQVYDSKFLQGLHYRSIGPHRGGRVTAVAGVRQHPNVFYMGSTGGGVWKTEDYGKIWRNISDEYFAVASIGSIDVADSDPNVIYVGTGSAGIRSNVSAGRGVYKSTDAGRTWSFMGLRDSGQIGALAIHPSDPDLVYIAALGSAFGQNPMRGIFRSKDGGRNWEKVLFISDRTGGVSLSIDPSNPRQVYAGMWTGERKPWTIISGSEEGGIFKTTDGGDSWTKLSQGLPNGVVGKSSVSVSPADPNRVYVLIEAAEGRGGLYRSDDAGAAFQRINDQKSLLYRPFYYTQVDAHPNDPDTVYVNNEGFFKSTDGGRNFYRMSTPHGDNHDMWMNPDNPDIMIQSNDGGANVTLDGGKTWSTQYNQATAELYQVEVDNRFPYWVFGAQQDNSTIGVPSKVSRGPLDPKQHWEAVSGCETGPIVVHPQDPDIIYGGCKGRHSRYNRRTGQVQQFWVYPHFNYGHTTADMPFRLQRTAPMILSPHNPSVIYHGSQYLHKSTDEGRTWEVISPDLTANEPDKQVYSGEPITRDITGEEIYSAIYAIAESPHREGVIWTGSNDGLLHLTRDGGRNWKNVTPPDLPKGGRVNRIEVSPHAQGKAYAAIYHYMLNDWSPYLYMTSDFGATWKRLTSGSNGIPADHPVRAVREDPDRAGLLYAGTEFGMFVSFDDGAHWQSFQIDLPATPITGIKVHRKDLVLSTMGRSFWILDNLSPLHQLNDEVASSNAWLFEPVEAYRVRWAGNLDRRFPGYGPEYPRGGAVIDYYLAEGAEGPVKLEILDSRGQVVRTFAASGSGPGAGPAFVQGMRAPVRRGGFGQGLKGNSGMHRFVWDMRYPGNKNAQGRRGGGGPMAVPGDYSVRLSVGEWQQSRPLRLRMDPRVAKDGVTIDDLQAQFDLSIRLRNLVDRTWDTIRNIRAVRDQLQSVARNARGAGLENGIAGEARDLSRQLTRVEKLLVQTESGKVGAQLEPQLIGQLRYLGSMIAPADQRPANSAYDRIKDIEKELEGYRSQLSEVLDEGVAEFNRMLVGKGVAPVIFTGPDVTDGGRD